MKGTPFGRYRLVDLLGRGGMGEVWRAYDTVTDRIVGVKVLPVHLASDEMFQQRFRREAKAAASLNNPHVVPIHDFGEIDGRLFVNMRLIEGRDLESMLRDGPMEPARAIRIVEQIASALEAAHRIGLVHRDVKPSNILVGEDDYAYLIDFGIARAAGESGLTDTGGAIGTWAYMAPERFQSGNADARSDIYALACVLFQALTGRQPFPANSFEQVVTAHLMQPPPKPSAVTPRVPTAVDRVIYMGMAKRPEERYASAKALAAAARDAVTEPMGRPFPPPVRPGAGPTVVAPYGPPTGDDSATRMAPPRAAYVAPPSQPSRPAALPPVSPPVTPSPATQQNSSGRGRKIGIAAAVVVVAVVAVTAIVMTGGSDSADPPAASGTSSEESSESESPSAPSSPSAASGAGIFNGSQPWNLDVSGSEVSDRSDAIIATLNNMGGWGTDNRFQIDFAIPVFFADGDSPRMPVVGIENYCFGSDAPCDPVPAEMPIPDDAYVEGSTNLECDISGNTEGQGDCHLLVVDRDAGKLYEIYQANKVGDDMTAQAFFIWDLNREYPENLRGDQCTSADAGGFPIAGLLTTADEVASGSIDHAIRFILPNDRMKAETYVHPASHAGGPESTEADAPPYGVRFRLRADFDDSGYTDEQRVVITALKTYGMLLSDGGQVPLTFADDRTSTAKWADLGIEANTFKDIGPDVFEVVELGEEIPLTYDCVRNPE